MSRTYDLILFGASGFTGRLVAEYLFRTYGVAEQLKWAMAGRNPEKLRAVRSTIGNEDIPILTADSLDPDSLDALCGQTRVLCTTVGPYAQYGSEVVAACVRQATHYCDLTGEVPWIRRMIDAHHETAQAKKLRIVHCCGFDSIPSEMSVLFLQGEAQKRYGAYCRHIKTGVKAASGGFSGGTIASLLNVLAEAEQDRRLYKMMFNPYGLNPADAQEGPDQPDLRSVVFDPHFKRWISPFLMAPINTRIVRRGHALRGYPYGKDFRYDEFTLSGKGFKGKISGRMYTLVLGLLMAARPGTLIKKIVQRFLPSPGEGPSEENREKGFWIYDSVGILPDDQVLHARIKGEGDPGYASTSKMLAEAAVCLALDDLPEQYGVTTPAAAMGDKLFQRLQDKARLSFRIKNEHP